MRLASNKITGPCWKCKKPHEYDRRFPNTICPDCRAKLKK